VRLRRQVQVFESRQVPEQHSSPEAHGQSVRRQQRSPLHSIDPPLVGQHSPNQAHLPPAGEHAQVPSVHTPVQQSLAVLQAPPSCSQHLPNSHTPAQQLLGEVHAVPLDMQQIPTMLQAPEQHSASPAHIHSSGVQQVPAAVHVNPWQQGAPAPHPRCVPAQQTPPRHSPSQHSSSLLHDRPVALHGPQRPALQ
jgi:hypothetical protein